MENWDYKKCHCVPYSNKGINENWYRTKEVCGYCNWFYKIAKNKKLGDKGWN